MIIRDSLGLVTKLRALRPGEVTVEVPSAVEEALCFCELLTLHWDASTVPLRVCPPVIIHPMLPYAFTLHILPP
jgi:hypothetical protein